MLLGHLGVAMTIMGAYGGGASISFLVLAGAELPGRDRSIWGDTLPR
jgi:hypothetical protein